MKKSKNLKRNIELANDINELYIIGLLQDSFFKAESLKSFSHINAIASNTIDFNTIQKAFPNNNDAELFIKKTVSSFNLDTKKSIPWEDYDELAQSCFKYIPSESKSEKLCLNFIRKLGSSHSGLYSHTYNLLPKRVLRTSAQLVRLILKKLLNENSKIHGVIHDRVYVLNALFIDTFIEHESIWTRGNKYLSFYLKYRREYNPYNSYDYYENQNSFKRHPQYPYNYHHMRRRKLGFNILPKKAQESRKIQRLFIPILRELTTFDFPHDSQFVDSNLEMHSEFFKYIDKELIRSLHPATANELLDIVKQCYANNYHFETFSFAYMKKLIEEQKKDKSMRKISIESTYKPAVNHRRPYPKLPF
tara:strand:+ start:10171 stop:11256 length:1086 start_codon:yes stop_codon:yes gene_type:complete